jgi:predicted alpha/beta-hydrolase family hydrolase
MAMRHVELTVAVPGAGSVSADAALPKASLGATVILAHGAGSDRRHPALIAFQEALAGVGWPTVLFNFPYREAGKRVPDSRPVLERTWRAIVEATRAEPRFATSRLVIGGRSMGGRIATHVAAEGTEVAGLVLLGFPLHAAGRPGIERAAHLARIGAPMLFVQGTRDALADRTLLAGVLDGLPRATVRWLADADHGFHVPKRSGRTDDQVRAEAVEAVAAWLDGIV